MGYKLIRNPKTDEPVKTRRTAVKHAPAGTSKIVKVEGGYIAFEFVSDYETWRNQR